MAVPKRLEPTRTGAFAGAGGLEIFWQAWLADSPRDRVVLAHGAGEHSARYGHVARALNAGGYSLWALDHRGHGKSEGPRALIDRLDNALEDMRTFIGKVSADSGGEPPVLLGHSMGGLLSTAYVLRHPETVRALVLSAPAVALETASRAERMAASLLTRIAPKLGVFAVDPAGVSRDPDVVRDYETDPLVFHDKLPVRTVAELAAEIETLPERVPAIAMPTLLMYGTADPIVPPRGSVMLGERIGAEDLTVTPYEGLYHEILNEPERDAVLEEIVSWLGARS